MCVCVCDMERVSQTALSVTKIRRCNLTSEERQESLMTNVVPYLNIKMSSSLFGYSNQSEILQGGCNLFRHMHFGAGV